MSFRFHVLAGIGLAALAAAAAPAQQAGGGTATYWMSAETSSGMAAAMGAGGDASAMGALMRGKSSAYAHNLTLQLGTGRRAPGTPAAEHLPPSTLRAGPSLPLVSPMRAPAAPSTGLLPSGAERPKGRMLFYWGCGERARAGQPLVVDFASLSAGKVPPVFARSAIKMMTPPSASAATYGEWPNDRSKTRVPAGGSLVGSHTVKGNYTPEINFTLAPGQDFLAPVKLLGASPAASGSIPLSWAPVPGSKAWFVTAMGAAENGDMIMWSSSETEAAAMMMDYLAPEEITRLIGRKVLLPATADRCTLPAEVAKAAPNSMLSIVALGGEANFSHPARPARAPASWRPEWTAKLRTKSTHMSMLGMDMSDMGGRDDDDGEEQAEAARPETKKEKLRRGIGRVLGY
jgi:hypothetical protein